MISNSSGTILLQGLSSGGRGRVPANRGLASSAGVRYNVRPGDRTSTGWVGLDRAAVPMRFDAERAMTRVGALDGRRFAGTTGERHAAAEVATEFDRLGLRVERLDVIGSRFPDLFAARLGWLGVGG